MTSEQLIQWQSQTPVTAQPVPGLLMSSKALHAQGKEADSLAREFIVTSEQISQWHPREVGREEVNARLSGIVLATLKAPS